MRKLEEKRELLYVIRTMDVLMSSGVGLEAALHTIGRGGYGIISEDFSAMMVRLRKGNSKGSSKSRAGSKSSSRDTKVIVNDSAAIVKTVKSMLENVLFDSFRMLSSRLSELIDSFRRLPRRAMF